MRHPDRKLPQPAAAFIGKLRPLKNHSEAAASLDRHMLRYLHHGRSKIGTASLGCMRGSAHNYSIWQASTRVQRLHAGGGQIKAPCGLRGLGVLCGSHSAGEQKLHATPAVAEAAGAAFVRQLAACGLTEECLLPLALGSGWIVAKGAGAGACRRRHGCGLPFDFLREKAVPFKWPAGVPCCAGSH